MHLQGSEKKVRRFAATERLSSLRADVRLHVVATPHCDLAEGIFLQFRVLRNSFGATRFADPHDRKIPPGSGTVHLMVGCPNALGQDNRRVFRFPFGGASDSPTITVFSSEPVTRAGLAPGTVQKSGEITDRKSDRPGIVRVFNRYGQGL